MRLLLSRYHTQDHQVRTEKIKKLFPGGTCRNARAAGYLRRISESQHCYGPKIFSENFLEKTWRIDSLIALTLNREICYKLSLSS
jgi:hypothetical protein